MNRKTTLLILVLLLATAACAPATTPTPAPAATSPPPPTATTLPLTPWEAPWYVEGVTVETYAGTGQPGYKDGPAAESQFNWPYGLAADDAGNLYVFDWRNYRIRRISSDGMVTTVAGTGEPGFTDGPANEAQFLGPGLLALDAAGNLYLADGGNHRIRLITPDGVISTLAGTGEPGYRDGSADQAQFNLPHGVALDAAGNVYVADMDNNRVRVITPDGEVRTLAGSGQLGYQDGPALEAQFDAPNSLTTDANGNVIVAEAYATELRGTHRLRLITPDGVVTTLAGSGYPGHKDGPASEARFSFPKCPTFDAGGNLLVANGFFHVGLVTPDGVVYTLAGTGEPGRIDGPGPVAQFIEPKCITVGPEGEVYVADGLVQAIRRITYGSPAAVARLPTPNPPSNRRAIKIGFSWVSAGLYGLFAARLAVDEANAAGGVTVNGEPYTLELVVSRACCGDEAAVFGAERLVEQGVVAVVAPLLRQGYMPQSPVYASAGVIHITPGGQDPSFTLEGPPTAYRLGPNVAYGGPVTARYAYEELGVRRAALLPETADFPQTAADAFQKAFETLGGEVFRHDVTAENLPETLNTIREEGAEAVLIFLPTFGFADALLEEVRGAGLPVPIIAYIGFGRINVGMAPESMYDIEPGRPRADMPGYADFAARFRAADFTRDPDRPSEWTTLAYDATNLIIAAIRRAAETGAVTRDSVVAAMEAFRDEPYQGAIGAIQFDEYGDMLDQPFHFRKVVRGEWVDVER